MAIILAICYAAPGEGFTRSALELLAAGQQLKEKLDGGTVQALLLGAGLGQLGAELVPHGAEQVLTIDHPRLENLEPEVVLGVLEQAARRVSPDIILFPHGLLGEGVAPRLAYRLGASIITDCVGFAVQEEAGAKQIRWLRPVYGGKAMAYMVGKDTLQIATLRSRAFEPLPADPARQGQVQPLDVDVAAVPARVRLLEKVVQAEEGVSLEHAQVIVSGGRGMGGPEGFVELQKLANLLKAGLAGSRPAADSGWVTHSRLVGQTGKIVAPSLYIAVGISGAPQHMSGAGSSKFIVAINKDEDASIFKQAHMGVVGEWQEVVPALIAACQRLSR